MSADTTSARSGQPPFYRRRGFWKNAVPVLAAIAAFLIGMAIVNALHGKPVKGIALPPDPVTPKTVKLTPSAAKDIKGLVSQFVHTAVARKNLAESIGLVGPALREGISLKQWKTGAIPVVPYPVDAKTTLVFEKPDWVHPKSVRYQVHVVTPDKPNQTKLTASDTFFVDLIKRDGRWLVNNWVPRYTVPLKNPNG